MRVYSPCLLSRGQQPPHSSCCTFHASPRMLPAHERAPLGVLEPGQSYQQTQDSSSKQPLPKDSPPVWPRFSQNCTPVIRGSSYPILRSLFHSLKAIPFPFILSRYLHTLALNQQSPTFLALERPVLLRESNA